MRPHFAIAASTDGAFSRSSADWLEPVTPTPPSSCASASPLPEEDKIATRKPSAASLRAAAAPMPLPPAVTSATLSFIAQPLKAWANVAAPGVEVKPAQSRVAVRKRSGSTGSPSTRTS